MVASDVTIQRVSGEQAAAHFAEILALCVEVYGEPPYEWTGELAGMFSRRFAGQCQQQGFDLVEARHDGLLIGMACGGPPAGWAWKGLLAPVSAEVSAEWPGRTFFVADLLVRAPWRRQGIARAMLDLLLDDRPQERAMLTALPAAEAAQAFYRGQGWRNVGQRRNSPLSTLVFDIMLKDLRQPA